MTGMEVKSYTPKRSPFHLDIMSGGRWKGTVSIPCTPGVEYGYEELKSMVRLRRPSLGRADFDLYPTDRPIHS